MSGEQKVLEVRSLSFSYGDVSVLDDVSLTVSASDSVAVVGRSGSGKSTLLSCALGLLRPTGGDVLIDGEVVSRRNAVRLRREKIGMVFQGGELLRELSPTENVVIAGLLAGLTTEESRERSTLLLDALGVPPGDRTIGDFSGGEQQRVALARALICRPRLLVADEPTGSLDTETRDEVLEVLRSLPDRFDCAMVLVTHDPVVAAVCGRVVRLTSGTLTEDRPFVGVSR